MEVVRIRIGGAQIPVTENIQKNISTIKIAVDWASENKVDYLVTPEGSLSGYVTYYDFEEVQTALTEIEKYSAKKKIGLCLGTMWQEDEYFGRVKRNQIRFYNDGELIGVTNKTHVIEHDASLPNDLEKNGVDIHWLTTEKCGLPIVGLICNDLWGHSWLGGKCIINEAQKTGGVGLFIHSTNGERGNDETKYFEKWHDAHLRLLSRSSQIPIFTVDNSIHMTGEDYDGETSSESGVVINGEWVTNVPRTGTQYFYHDFIGRYIGT